MVFPGIGQTEGGVINLNRVFLLPREKSFLIVLKKLIPR